MGASVIRGTSVPADLSGGVAVGTKRLHARTAAIVMAGKNTFLMDYLLSL
jgi:hypothetical protein